MIQLLKRFILWLEARFPPKVVVTQNAFNALSVGINTHCAQIEVLTALSKDKERRIADLEAKVLSDQVFGERIARHEDRINSVDESIKAIKDLLSKNGTPVTKTEKEKLREQFIKDGDPRGVREAVQSKEN